MATPSCAKVPVYGSMKPTRTRLDCARTISGSSRLVEAAPTRAAPRESTRRRVVMGFSLLIVEA
jgi:hypothetical protein